jgi:queuine tRNA-ribosyltransferase
VKANEILGAMLLTWANIAYYQELMRGIRQAISEGRFTDFAAETRENWQREIRQ